MCTSFGFQGVKETNWNYKWMEIKSFWKTVEVFTSTRDMHPPILGGTTCNLKWRIEFRNSNQKGKSWKFRIWSFIKLKAANKIMHCSTWRLEKNPNPKNTYWERNKQILVSCDVIEITISLKVTLQMLPVIVGFQHFKFCQKTNFSWKTRQLVISNFKILQTCQSTQSRR